MEVGPVDRWAGQPLRRREDAELLTGRGRYIADLQRPAMLHAVFLRSPYAHARVRSIDAAAARAMPGVHAVLTGADLPAGLGVQPCSHLFQGQRETPYYEVTRLHAAFALVGAAGLVLADGGGRIDLSRLALCGVAGIPFAPAWLEEVLTGEAPAEKLFARVGAHVSQDLEPSGTDREYRRQVAGTLAARALATASRRAGLEVAA